MRFAEQFTPTDTGIHCIIGLGALHHLAAAIQFYKDRLSPLLLWEPILEIETAEEFQTSLLKIKDQLFGLRIPFLILKSNDSRSIWREQIVTFLKETGAHSINILPFPSYQRIVPNEIHSFIEFLKSVQNEQSQINSNTKAHFQKVWTHNYLKNMERISSRKTGISWLFEVKISNLIPVFVGASPSLENEIPKLKQNRNSYLILCSDTAVQYLLSNQLEPDYILSFDSGRGTLFHFLPTIPQNIPIITWLGANTHIFDLKNPLVLTNTNYPMDQIIQTKLKNIWPSLENPSLNVAGIGKAIALLGRSKMLLLAGVDFLAENGKSHCRGTGYENYRLPNVNRKLTWQALNENRMYAKKTGKNKIASEKLWAEVSSLKVLYLKDHNIDSIQVINQKERECIYGFQGFPQIGFGEWEQAFQTFPDVISPDTISRWFLKPQTR